VVQRNKYRRRPEDREEQRDSKCPNGCTEFDKTKPELDVFRDDNEEWVNDEMDHTHGGRRMIKLVISLGCEVKVKERIYSIHCTNDGMVVVILGKQH